MHTCIFSIINLIFLFFDEHSISRKHFRHNILWIVSWMKEIASDRLIIYRWCNQRERVTDKEQHHQHWSVITELNICTYRNKICLYTWRSYTCFKETYWVEPCPAFSYLSNFMDIILILDYLKSVQKITYLSNQYRYKINNLSNNWPYKIINLSNHWTYKITNLWKHWTYKIILIC